MAAVMSGVMTLSCMTAMNVNQRSIAAELETAADKTENTSKGSGELPVYTDDYAPEKQDWEKADISDYDVNLSLVDYKLTTPDMYKSGVAPADMVRDIKLTPEEQAALDAKRKALRDATPLLNRKNENVEPTAVEVITSGGEVIDVPPSQERAAVQLEAGDFTFVTYGWGHGVGMSQNGANNYAIYSGWTYQDILFHYYPDTYLMNTGTAEDDELTIEGKPAGDALEVVSKIVYNEVGGGFATEAIKAQAVAVYTYLKYNGDDSADLRGKEDPPQNVIDACREVLGEALYYGDDFALTMFSASCADCSANCYEMFAQDLPYLRSVPSDYDAAYDPHYGTVTYIPADELKHEIESRYDITLSDDPDNWIQPIRSEETGYITDILLDGQIYVKGYPFSLAMGLKSCKFDVYYTPSEDEAKSEKEETTEAPTDEAADAPKDAE